MVSDGVCAYVVGYGSLMSSEFTTVNVFGWRRCWNVANYFRSTTSFRSTIKQYVDPDSGVLFDGFVTFLNVERSVGTVLAAVLIPVTEEQLNVLDARELNYDRVDVAKDVDVTVGLPVWLYVGKQISVAKFEECTGNGNVVISSDYKQCVDAAVAALGDQFSKRYAASTCEPTVPIKQLIRVIT